MFIVWGRKTVYRKLGYVADFCPICRGPQAFELQRIGSAGHVYYISSGEGELVGYQRVCEKCGTSLQAEPATYAAMSKTRAPLAELVKQTYPGMERVLQERLALEERVKLAPASLSKEERTALIRSPFVLLSPQVEKRFASTHLDKEVFFALVAALLLLSFGPALVGAIARDATELGVLVSLAAGVVLVGWQVATSGRRFMRRQVIPVLAASLRPLKPTDSELQAVLGELKQFRHKIGAKLALSDLRLALGQGAR